MTVVEILPRKSVQPSVWREVFLILENRKRREKEEKKIRFLAPHLSLSLSYCSSPLHKQQGEQLTVRLNMNVPNSNVQDEIPESARGNPVYEQTRQDMPCWCCGRNCGRNARYVVFCGVV